MTDANPSSWMLVMDKVTNGLFGLGGVAPGAWIGYWKESRQRQQRNRSYWSALSAEVDLCKGYGAAYVRDDVKAPLYRLSTIAYDNAFPARLGTGAVTEEEAQSILRFYSQVMQINRGLEYAHTARQDDDLLDGEVSRLRQKASALTMIPISGILVDRTTSGYESAENFERPTSLARSRRQATHSLTSRCSSWEAPFACRLEAS
jgi:hypothetical protein